jgi:hypothetical protein
VEIKGVKVTLASPEGIVEVVHDAIGMQVGGAGELLVLRVLEESDNDLKPINITYPAYVYAPGTWQMITLLEPKASPKRRVPKIVVPEPIHRV